MDLLGIRPATRLTEFQRSHLARNGVHDDRFPPTVLGEISRLTIPAVELRRRPLTVGLTVDSRNPHERDDAFSVQKIARNYLVAVSIADVTALLCCDGPTDLEARRRGSSIYAGSLYIPMFPEQLIELASLIPGVPRLTWTVVMTFNEKGKRLGTQVHESVFVNRWAMDFEEAGRIVLGQESVAVPLIAESLYYGRELAQLLRERRKPLLEHDSGLLDNSGFHKGEEPLTEEGVIGSLIVEELMVATNTAIAELMIGKSPLLWRCHGLKGREVERGQMKVEIQELSASSDETRFQALLEQRFSPAYYSTKCRGHLGLGLDEYTHFTSPIRRYPDLVVQRLLRVLLRKGSFRGHEQREINQVLDPLAYYLSWYPQHAKRIAADVAGMPRPFAAMLENSEKMTFARLCSLKSKVFERLLKLAVNSNLAGLPLFLLALKKRGFTPASHLAFLFQKSFADQQIQDFVLSLFEKYESEHDYIDLLNNLAVLERWEGLTYLERAWPPTRGIRLPRYRGWFRASVKGKFLGVEPRGAPSGARKRVKEKAAFAFLKAYLIGDLVEANWRWGL